jgi:uncharacterized iron-regulated membrane protein
LATVSRRLRQTIFWAHLVVGIAAGIVIAVMCFTGAALAFEKEIIAWADRDLRGISPSDSTPLSLAEIEQKAGFKPSAITISTDPSNAILVAGGRTNAVYVNQYSGEVSAPASPKTRAFMSAMIEWHRFLAQSGESRPRGKMITGASNLVFLFLAISGIYLWWPRNWNIAQLAFKRGLTGKARDWNWHNVIGIWTAPVLIVLTATALPISYKWAGDAIYKLTGSEAPQPPKAAGESRRDRATLPTIPALLELVKKEVPNAEQITIRPGQLTLAIKASDQRPRFSSTQITLDSKTFAIVKKESYADQNAGRKVRSWTRFLHTGEALGPIGQFVAGIASLGGVVLVWTGFALAARRFFGKKKNTSTERVAASEPELVEERL